MESKLDPLFKAAVEEHKVPAVAAVILDVSGKVLYKTAGGSVNSNDPSAAPYTSSTTTIMWSTTKLVASVAALQLIEQGKLKLDDPVEKYVPEIKNIQVMDGLDENGKVKLRAPKTKATVLQLFTHTAGFSYDFFDGTTLKWRTEDGQTPHEYVSVGSMQSYRSPFVHDPGTAYCYGVNTDWLGFVVEAVSGQSLKDYVDKHICQPLGLKNTSAHLTEGKDHLFVHLKGEDGTLTAAPPIAYATNPEKYGGGAYLHSTLDDYSTFLLALLNNGTHPQSGAKILEPATVKECLFRDYIPQVGCSNASIGDIQTVNAIFSSAGTFLPGTKLGWSCGLMLNLEDTPHGRKAGSGAWAGLGNLFYWLDPAAGKLGLIMTSILPFMDKDILGLFDAMERVAYGHDVAKTVGEKGSNFLLP